MRQCRVTLTVNRVPIESLEEVEEALRQAASSLPQTWRIEVVEFDPLASGHYRPVRRRTETAGMRARVADLNRRGAS